MGRLVYERLGFHAVGFTDIHAGSSPDRYPIYRISPRRADLDELVARDTKATGLTRPFLWEALLTMGTVRMSERARRHVARAGRTRW